MSASYRTAICARGAIALALCAGGWPARARAQAVDDGAAAAATVPGDEIIVTARRRAESLDRVPLVVSVIGGDTLARQNITSVQDVQYLTPSLNVSTNTARSSNNYTLRGQGTTYGTEPSVVAYFAEVPIPGGGNGNAALFDMANVQVLNGPQGTLFGRNSVGGAILFTPAPPANRTEGYAKLAYGDYDNFQQEAVVNVPLVDDKILLRAGVSHRTRDGFTRDVLNGRRYDDVDATVGRVSLLVRPTETIDSLLVANYTRTNENGTGTVLSLVNPAGLSLLVFPQLADIAAAQALRGPRRTAQTPDLVDRQRLLQIVDTTTARLTDELTLKNIVSFTAFRQNVRSDVSGTPLPLLTFEYTPGYGGPQNNNIPATNQFTEELQLSGEFAGKAFEWTLGGYYQNNDPRHTLQSLRAFGGPAVLTDRGIDLRALAGFGQATLDLGALTPSLTGLKLTGGYRYSHDRRRDYVDSYVQVGSSFDTGGACALTSGSYPNCRLDYARSFSASTYTGAVEYQVNRNLMVYATARSGFKSGGFNLGAPPASGFAFFEPEKVKDVEAGVKTNVELESATLRFNLAVFRDKYSNIQRPLLRNFGGVVTTYVVNATSAVIKGVELESGIKFRNGLGLAATYSYLDSRYGSFQTDQGDFTGFRLPYTPKQKVSASVTYDTALADDRGALEAGATYSYQSRYRNLDVLDPDVFVPGYSLVSADLGWKKVMGSNFDVALFARNLFNKLFIIGKGDYYYSLGFTTNVYGEPRTYGAALTYHFGA